MLGKRITATLAFAILVFSTVLTASSSYADYPRAGSSCTAVGAISKGASGPVTCSSNGSGYTWTKGISKSAAYKPKGNSFERCDYEPYLKSSIANKIQTYIQSEHRCIGLIRMASMAPSKTGPVQKDITEPSDTDVKSCKVQNPDQSQSWKGFPSDQRAADFALERHPSPTTVMQVIPISAPDAPSRGKSPYQDYKYYFDSLKNYFGQINDGPGNLELRVPDKYFEFPKPIAPFAIEHGKDNELSNSFANSVVAMVDSQFDFKIINYVLIVVPAGTPSGVIGQQGWGGIMSAEGRLPNISVAQPATFSGPNNSKTPEMASLGMWIHEFYHPGINLGDNHGDDTGVYGVNRGMGDWGLMSRSNGDLLAWQKWLLGFTQDTQVVCIKNKDKVSITHLVPSSVKSKKSKLIVIPVGDRKVLVVESIRSVGLSYKYGSERSGALVYIVDASDTRHEYGYTVMYPDSRIPTQAMPEGKRYTNSSLKLGESLTYEGVKITNVEWGEFGDVIKVEPVK